MNNYVKQIKAQRKIADTAVKTAESASKRALKLQNSVDNDRDFDRFIDTRHWAHIVEMHAAAARIRRRLIDHILDFINKKGQEEFTDAELKKMLDRATMLSSQAIIEAREAQVAETETEKKARA